MQSRFNQELILIADDFLANPSGKRLNNLNDLKKRQFLLISISSPPQP